MCETCEIKRDRGRLTQSASAFNDYFGCAVPRFERTWNLMMTLLLCATSTAMRLNPVADSQWAPPVFYVSQEESNESRPCLSF
jgi:hypothetical protein